VRVPFNNIKSVENNIGNKNIVAVMVEPIQGESGIQVPDTDYLNKLRTLCDENDWLLILDEIQTGMGRTGQWFAYQHNGIKPDVVTLAKALANGVPIGACIANEKTASVMKPGNHGSTFGGNPLACAAALAVIATITSEQLISKAADTGTYLIDGLKHKLQSVSGVREIRGLGLMIGIDLERPCSELVLQALDQGLLFSVQAEHVIRLLPPLILSKEQADTIIEQVSQLVSNWCQQAAA